ncbi:MAG TPA: PKD domain-containing protein [Flavitalea sp.]|nr:PKD domain-containing protein [Flavitalea sp.]
MSRKRLLTFVLLLITTLKMNAQTNFEFVENKGQWDSRVRFKGELSSGAFFLQDKGFTVLLYNSSDLTALLHHDHASNPGTKKILEKDHGSDRLTRDNMILRSHSFNVEFTGATAKPQLLPEKQETSMNNYFIGNDRSKWVSNARIFHVVVYKNVYPNIDVRYYSDNSKLKYDIIVHPGGNVRNISLKYDGVNGLSVRNRELIIKTSVGDVKEQSPYSYQSDLTHGRKEIECNYVVTGNTVQFAVKNYDPSTTLVIDPTLVFSSFTGSPANQYGFTATPGPDGSLYSGGIVFGAGFPTTPGAYQGSFRGGGQQGIDIGIMKFSPNGSQRLYATYLGGNNDDYPHSLFCDPQGNLVVMGRSYSGNSYPTVGTNEGVGGSTDIIVSKLNAAGTALIGSIRIGGDGQDGVNIEDVQQSGNHSPKSLIRNYGDDSRSEVILDQANNIYIAAQTKSTNFPTPGGFQTTIGGGQDGVVIKVTPNCDKVIWSSYLGGDKDDGAFVLSVNPSNGNIYVSGATVSANFPGDKTGTIGPVFRGGEADGFVSIISPAGNSLLKSTYLGTSEIDIIYGIQHDKLGFPYVMGVTRGVWTVTSNVSYSNPNSSQFVSKLKPDLSGYEYSTVFGTGVRKPNMSPVAFLVDRCENVYISGWGGWSAPGDPDPFDQAGVAGMPTTSDAIKRVTDNRDMYFIVIKKNAQSLLYGTFFGQDGGYGEHVDGGTSRFDQQGAIYQAICANCGGNATFPTTPGVIGPTNRAVGTGGCNLAAVKINFNFAGVASGPKVYFNGVPDSIGCVPFNVVFRDTVRNAQSYQWDFSDGSPSEFTTNFQTTHTFNSVGTYRVRLIAVDSNTCNIRDTAFLTIRVRDDIASPVFIATKQPPCQSLSYLFTNQSAAPAGKPFKANSFTWDFGDGTRLIAGPGNVTHAYQNAGTYKIRLILTDTNYCNAPDSMSLDIRISPLVAARFVTPATGCAPYQAVFDNTSLAGQTFFWDFGDGSTSNAVNPSHLYQNIGTYTVTLVATDPSTCNITDTISKTIVVSPKPTADFNFTPSPPEVNKPTIFFNLSIGGIRHKYLFGDGDSTIRLTMDTVQHQYNATGTYTACLVTTNAAGCTDTICKPVQAIIEPLLDVPNAFTPGRFGRNGVVKVEGFGIGRMTFRIYNRWGQKLFESGDRKIGWNGTYKGVLQPQDVYAYTLDVEFTDGTKARKTGDITLIR